MAKKTKKKTAVKAKKKPAKKPVKKAVKKAAKKTAKKISVKAKPKAVAAPKKTAAKRKGGVSGPAPVFAWRIPKPGERLVGIVDDFYSHISVITFTLTAPLSVGDAIHVRGHTTDLEQSVTSMQCEHKDVANGKPGMGVGIRISDKARRGDYIYKIAEE